MRFVVPNSRKVKTNFVSKNGVGGSSYYATLTSYEVNCRPLFSCCLTSFFVLLLSIYDSKKVSSQPLTIFMTTHFLLQHTLIYTFSPKNDDQMMFSFNISEYRYFIIIIKRYLFLPTHYSLIQMIRLD